MLFLAIAGFALLHAAWLALTVHSLPETTRRARWLRHWSSFVLPFLGVDVQLRGRSPDGGILVCNHVSYLDIPALATATEMVFLSKAEVRRWPLLGAIAQAGGTLFIRRERRSEVAHLAPEFVPIINEGVVLTLFPEGTSTSGDRILPFYSSLLAPAAAHNWPVTPAHIRYEIDDGSVQNDVAFWRDMTFLPHFLKLLGKRRVRAVITLGEPLRHSNRKALALNLHRTVSAIAEASPTTLRPS